MDNQYYNIEYYNSAFKETHTIKVIGFKEAVDKAIVVKTLIEMENVKLFKVTEIDF